MGVLYRKQDDSHGSATHWSTQSVKLLAQTRASAKPPPPLLCPSTSPKTTPDTIPLDGDSNSFKVQHKYDNLMFRFTVKGESRMIRMQFDGSSTAEAVNQCSRAVEKLMEYVPVMSVEVAAIHTNQPPTEVPPAAQQSCQGTTGQTEPEAAQGSVSIRRLAQHFLGETALALPNMYSHSSLAPGDLEPILRVCLLDPNFPAFVEKVQDELEKLQEE
ncbi:hypothetical protein CRENBAI_000704 [Crenichthys baileyi]|uniref:Uncharacterized protein n=1 Tax=Crenichthys baileyi TaxID=28760 RepID=A0AAV9S2N1_9TELE